MVLKSNPTPTRLEKILFVITGAAIKFEFHFSRQLRERGTIFSLDFS